MKKKYIILSFVLACASLNAQNKNTQKADKLFNQYEYVSAAQEYLKLENGSVEKYVNDYFQNSNDAVLRMKWKTMYYLNTTYEESNTLKDLIKYYLLSTDFFNQEQLLKHLL